jgi:excisionase family DNA binding protein
MPKKNDAVNKPQTQKAGWRVNEWAAAVGISRSRIYELLADKTIASVRFGGARIITTPPSEFLASLAA